MTATLYQPNRTALVVPANDLILPDSNGYATVTQRVAELLQCPLGMVDVLASSKDYVIYSIFDDEGATNLVAMAAMAALTGCSFDPKVEDEIISGSILIVTSA